MRRMIAAVILLPLIECDDGSAPATPAVAPPAAAMTAGMSKYPYVVADGGPHMLLPAEAAGQWTGSDSMAPTSDYGRACAATAKAPMSVIPVGSTSAIVFADPPMSSWGRSADGLVEAYVLHDWTSPNLDALVAKASAVLRTPALTRSGQSIQFHTPDAWLLHAGDTPTSTAYGV